MNDGIAMIEAARRRHELHQQYKPLTFYNSVRKVVGQERDILAAMAKKEKIVEDKEKRISKTLGFTRKLQIVYAPMVYRFTIIRLMELVTEKLKQNYVKATRKIVSEFAEAKKLFDVELSGLTDDAEDCIQTISWWWMEDGAKALVNALHYAYSNEILRAAKGIDGNLSDLLAWIFTIRDMARVVCAYEDGKVKLLNEIAGGDSTFMYRNQKDAAITVASVCDRLIHALLGSDCEFQSRTITDGRKALEVRLETYDAKSVLAEYRAKSNIEANGGECPSERCSSCEKNPCKTLRAAISYIEKQK